MYMIQVNVSFTNSVETRRLFINDSNTEVMMASPDEQHRKIGPNFIVGSRNIELTIKFLYL